jgi:HlyD family secretion protein
MSDLSSPPPSSLDEFLGRRALSPRARVLRRAALIAAAILVLAGLYRLFFGHGAPIVHYDTTAVRRGNLSVAVAATGNLQPTNEVQVGSETSGLITEVLVDNNEPVRKGQVLARLDTARLNDAILQAKAQRQSAEASVVQARATLTLARANLARLEQVHTLSGGKVPSASELDTARAEAARDEANVAVAEASVAQAKAALSTAETQFSKAVIRSPVNGVVLSRQIDPGQTVAASFSTPTLFYIAEDLRTMRLDVKVDEADVGEVRAGLEATFTVDAYPEKVFKARVLRVDYGANATRTVTIGATSSSSGASSGSSSVVAYTAVLSVDNPDGILRPGMTATARIVTNERTQVLLVPNPALRFTPQVGGPGKNAGGGVAGAIMFRPKIDTGDRQVGVGRGSTRTVYVLGAGNTPRAVEVKVGETNGNLTEVSGKDLHEGDAVITGQLAGGPASAPAGGPR